MDIRDRVEIHAKAALANFTDGRDSAILATSLAIEWAQTTPAGKDPWVIAALDDATRGIANKMHQWAASAALEAILDPADHAPLRADQIQALEGLNPKTLNSKLAYAVSISG